MFNQTDLDEREELPAPFCLEKHNFNPHDCMGDFDYVNGKPNVIQKAPGVFYDGKRFDIRDVMGEFEKDQHGNI